MLNGSTIPRIQGSINLLTSTQKKLAEYIIDNYKEAIDFTVTELSEKSGVSEATVIRFCKDLGYKGYQDFKINLAKEVISPYKQINLDLEETDEPMDIVNKIFNSNISVLNETLNILDIDAMEKAAEKIVNAKRLEIAGSGGSAFIALDVQHKFLKIGIKCYANPDAHSQAMSASLLGEGDVIMGISHSGSSTNVINCLELAKSGGATTIALTTQGKSPILKFSDIALFSATKETAFKSESLSARIAQLTVIDSLMTLIAFKNYDYSHDAIHKTRHATSSTKY